MNSVEVRFSFEAKHTDLPEISFSDSDPRFRNIRVSPSTDSVSQIHHIIVEKKTPNAGTGCLKAVIDEAIKEAELFLPIFGAAAEFVPLNLECTGYLVDGTFYLLEDIFPELKRKDNSFNCVRGITEKGIPRIKERILKKWDAELLQEYFEALSKPDPIRRFLSLYLILLDISSDGRDSQKAVDDLLLSIDSTLQMSSIPHKKSKFETVFSRLRNELSHKREGVSKTETITQVHLHIMRFEELVKQVVLSKAGE